MKVAAVFFVCVPFGCTADLGCECEYVPVSILASAHWDVAAGEPDFTDVVVTGWKNWGTAPSFDSLSRREQAFAMDALYTACRDEDVRAEWEGASLPYSTAVYQ